MLYVFWGHMCRQKQQAVTEYQRSKDKSVFMQEMLKSLGKPVQLNVEIRDRDKKVGMVKILKILVKIFRAVYLMVQKRTIFQVIYKEALECGQMGM